MRTTTPGPRPNSSQRAWHTGHGEPEIATDIADAGTRPEPAEDDDPAADDREPAARAGVAGERAGLPPEPATAMTATATATAATANSSNLGRRRRRMLTPTPRSGPTSRKSTSSGGTSSPRFMHPSSLACRLCGMLVFAAATVCDGAP